MIITDEDVKKIFFHFEQNLSNRYFCNPRIMSYYIHEIEGKYNKDVYKYVMERYNDGTDDFKENLYRILLSIEEKPKCKRCGKVVDNFDFNKREYKQYCCISCLRKSTKYNILPETIKERVQKWRKTCLDKYGVDNVSILPQVKEGAYKYNHSIENLRHCKKISRDPKVREKSNNTKRKNNTFNTSKPEKELFDYIKHKFPNVIRQYKDDIRYPYNCDFYIPELDYFIELQGYYTHGKHPFNPNSEDDLKLIEQYKEKYGPECQAITIWTIKDVEKRNKAKEEKLNFKEVWTLDEGKEFIDNLFEISN